VCSYVTFEMSFKLLIEIYRYLWLIIYLSIVHRMNEVGQLLQLYSMIHPKSVLASAEEKDTEKLLNVSS